jgi:hypothetical protein
MHLIKKISSFLLVVLLLGSCAKKITFNPSSVIPSTTGSVSIKKDKNDNYGIELHVRNLPEAKDLTPPKRNYTVWMETNDNRELNIGNLESTKGLFSKTRKGELKTTSSFRPVRLFVTPEDEETPEIPGAIPILSTDLFKVK